MPTTDELQAQLNALTERVVILEGRMANWDANEQAKADVAEALQQTPHMPPLSDPVYQTQVAPEGEAQMVPVRGYV